MKPPAPFALLLLCACTTPANTPSLAPRPGEAIDPRLPVAEVVVAADASRPLLARLDALVAEARAGDEAFRAAAADAERRVAEAGPAQSESWTVAQQAVSAAQAARGATTRVIGDIDAIAAAAIAQTGGIPAADAAAIRKAAAEVAAIDQRQAERIAALQARLAH